MAWVWLAFAGTVVLALTALYQWRAVRHRQALYAEKVGLDLAGLVALLPSELRDVRFTAFLIAPLHGPTLKVGLLYPSDRRHVGNPPNVGLEFDLATGVLLGIVPEGVPLGLK